MRQIGELANETEMRRFQAYLIAQGVGAVVEPQGNAWSLWVREENEVERVRGEFASYRENPADPRFSGHEQTAASRQRDEARRREEARRNTVNIRSRWARMSPRAAPLVTSLLAISVAVSLLGNFGDERTRKPDSLGATIYRQLGFWDGLKTSKDPLVDIRRGQIWRIVTPMFLHFNMLHLAFNMMQLLHFGSQLEGRKGPGSLLVLVLVIAVISNVAQAMLPALSNSARAVLPAEWIVSSNPFGGMSGVIYGLFGYSWMKSRYDPAAGIRVHSNDVVMMLIWCVACFFLKNIANFAHIGGLLIGVVLGIAPMLWRGK